MPGIHPSSSKQVRWAFAAERRGQLRPSPSTPWTSDVAKMEGSIAREWGHRWKCWSWDEKARGKIPADCKNALQLLDTIRREHPTWKVPTGVTRKAPRPVVVPIRPPIKVPERPAARAISIKRPKAPRPTGVEIAAGRRPKPKAQRSIAQSPSHILTAEELVREALRRHG